MSAYETALELAKRNIYYYPTVPNGKSGLKGSHGFSDAINDDSMAREWFQGTNNNIGINLKKSGLMVVDIDMNHGDGVSGRHNLLKVFQEYGRLPDDSLIEKTPRGGVHWFLKVPPKVEVKNVVNAFFPKSRIDLMTTNILIAPSMIDGNSYAHVSGSYDDIKQAPPWVLSSMQDKDKTGSNTGFTRTKMYTGRLLDSIVDGAVQGQRNDYFTRLAGSMFAVGTENTNVLELLSVVNKHFVSPPLPEKELETIYRSVLSRELRRLKVN